MKHPNQYAYDFGIKYKTEIRYYTALFIQSAQAGLDMALIFFLMFQFIFIYNLNMLLSSKIIMYLLLLHGIIVLCYSFIDRVKNVRSMKKEEYIER